MSSDKIQPESHVCIDGAGMGSTYEKKHIFPLDATTLLNNAPTRQKADHLCDCIQNNGIETVPVEITYDDQMFSAGKNVSYKLNKRTYHRRDDTPSKSPSGRQLANASVTAE